jgi:predicted transcriptional regulator
VDEVLFVSIIKLIQVMNLLPMNYAIMNVILFLGELLVILITIVITENTSIFLENLEKKEYGVLRLMEG